MNIIHVAESDSKDIPDGQIVRTRCHKTLIFRSHGSKPLGGIICQLCDGSRSRAGNAPFIFAVFEEQKPLAHTAPA